MTSPQGSQVTNKAVNRGRLGGILLWGHIRTGMFIHGVAEDHAEHTGREDAQTEYTFKFWGRVLHVTQRKLVYEGCWEWLDGVEACTPDDPQVSGGTFTILRGGCVWIRQHVDGPLWTRED